MLSSIYLVAVNLTVCHACLLTWMQSYSKTPRTWSCFHYFSFKQTRQYNTHNTVYPPYDTVSTCLFLFLVLHIYIVIFGIFIYVTRTNHQVFCIKHSNTHAHAHTISSHMFWQVGFTLQKNTHSLSSMPFFSLNVSNLSRFPMRCHRPLSAEESF